MPQDFGGRGDAPSPGVLIRAALGSCLAIGYMLWASRLGVPVSKLEVVIQADSDDGGLLGTSDTVPGYSSVRYCVRIESSAPEQEILAMLEKSEQHSPLLDVFSHPVACERQVEIITAEPT